MTAAALLAYALALLVTVVTPGPAVVALVATGVAKGARPALALGFGITAGDIILVALALLGLTAAAAAFGWAFAIVKYAGAAWLVWLGILMWRAPAEAPAAGSDGDHRLLRHIGLGLAIALGNPKAILFHASLMPLLIDIARLSLAEAGLILAIVAAINRIGGTVMIGTGALIAAR